MVDRPVDEAETMGMSEMINRVAEALYNRAVVRGVEKGFSGENLVKFSDLLEMSKNDYRDSAKAAICTIK